MIKYQKVIKVGNSLAVTLDQAFVQQAAIKAGDNLAASYQPDKRLFSMSQSKNGVQGAGVLNNEAKAILSAKITPELESWTDSFLKENQEALEALKDL